MAGLVAHPRFRIVRDRVAVRRAGRVPREEPGPGNDSGGLGGPPTLTPCGMRERWPDPTGSVRCSERSGGVRRAPLGSLGTQAVPCQEESYEEEAVPGAHRRAEIYETRLGGRSRIGNHVE